MKLNVPTEVVEDFQQLLGELERRQYADIGVRFTVHAGQISRVEHTVSVKKKRGRNDGSSTEA